MYTAWSPVSGDGSKFIRHEIGLNDYKVQFTDLRFVFEECLTEDEIFKRANQLECSIDPSEDANNFRYFMAKLQAALDCSRDTTLDVPDLSSETNPTKLDINITCVLPPGLSDLTWTFHLRRMKPDALKSELLAPLLGLVCAEQQRITQLVNIIREKDTVITRILDKFDSTDIDFANIFPTAGVVKHRKGDQTESFRKAVKGLAEFDVASWEDQSLELNKNENSTSPPEMLVTSLKLLTRPAVRENISHLLTKRFQADGQEMAKETASLPSPKIETQDSILSIEDFQRQTPPPKGLQAEETPSPTREGEPTTIREESTSTETSKQSPTKTGRKLGTLGGAKPEVNKKLPSLNSKEKSTVNPNGSESNAQGQLEQGRAKLGQLGGKKARPDPETNDTTTESPEVEDSSRPRRGKIGQLGGQQKPEREIPIDRVTASVEERPSSSRIKQESQDESSEVVAQASSKPQEIMQGSEDVRQEEDDDDPTEKANRRREELKRQMEEKSKAQPKKKRRF